MSPCKTWKLLHNPSLRSEPDEVRRIYDEFADNGIDLEKWWIEDE
jgi:hypothetical protein